MAGSANRRRRQSDGAHQAAESRSASKQQTNPARTTQIRFRKISAFPDSFLTPRRSQRNEGRTEVLVWIHGGGLYDGESNDYDADALVKTGPTVVVTINYRLGLLGYLAHPALDAEGHDFANYGLMDQLEALRWVHRNIAAFGGDPGNVTVGGQSAGATSTAAVMISPASAGLVHRAIFQSGPLLTVAALSVAESRGAAFAAAAGCGQDATPAS